VLGDGFGVRTVEERVGRAANLLDVQFEACMLREGTHPPSGCTTHGVVHEGALEGSEQVEVEQLREVVEVGGPYVEGVDGAGGGGGRVERGDGVHGRGVALGGYVVVHRLRGGPPVSALEFEPVPGGWVVACGEEHARGGAEVTHGETGDGGGEGVRREVHLETVRSERVGRCVSEHGATEARVTCDDDASTSRLEEVEGGRVRGAAHVVDVEALTDAVAPTVGSEAKDVHGPQGTPPGCWGQVPLVLVLGRGGSRSKGRARRACETVRCWMRSP